MSIRCEYHNLYTEMQRKPYLCGSHTIDSIGKYYKSLASLTDEYKSFRNITYRRTSANERVQEIEQGTEAIIESPQNITRQKLNKKRKTSRDWWSKYEKALSEGGPEEIEDEEEIISPLKIYPCELEKVEEFKATISRLQKFALFKGKCGVYSKEVQCQFKGIKNS